MKKIKINELSTTTIGITIILDGWVRYNRISKNIGFIELVDGSNIKGIQIVYKETELISKEQFFELKKLTLSTPISIQGKVVKRKQGELEIHLIKLLKIYNTSSLEKFLGKKSHGLEFLRLNSHIRPKTQLFQSVFTLRSKVMQAIHSFFEQENFYYLSSPIITMNDAEGGGESFFVKIKGKKGFEKFWNNEGSLSVSGQLHAEAYAQALGQVYTFAPTFRAENSKTKSHAAEFWMIEPEAAFMDHFQMMELAEKLIRYVLEFVLKNCDETLSFLETKLNKVLKQKLNSILAKEFQYIDYQKALEILQDAVKSGFKFENKNIEFGLDFGREHEKYLTNHYKSPVFVYNFPKSFKAFYMYQNEDGKTVRGFDLLIDDIGEIIGGSQREGNYETLLNALKEKNLSSKGLEWYLDLRKMGYAPSSGFGLGLERLIMFVSGMDNIRDVIPFPRTTGELKF